MSLMHSEAFEMINKCKVGFDKNNPPDYMQRRSQEIPACVPESVTVKQITSDGFAGEYLSKEGNSKDKFLLYIHGGGFVGGSPASKRAFTGYVANELGYNVYSVRYRLAPENPFPCGAEDCIKAYKTLADKHGAKNICMIGESAGGNLVVSTVLQAKSKGLELPACIAVFSPTLQYTETFSSYKRNVRTDCMLDVTFLDEVRSTYLVNKENETNPYAAPLYGDFSGFPPTYIGVSDSEYLYDDSAELYKKLQSAGVESKLDVYHKKMHAFQVITVFPESKKALQDVKRFIDRYLSADITHI